MMRIQWSLGRAATIAAVLATAVQVLSVVAQAQSNLTEPVYRVASTNTAPATQPEAAQPPAAQTTPAKPVAAVRLDFTKQGDEHPLLPVIRGLKASQEIIDKSIREGLVEVALLV